MTDKPNLDPRNMVKLHILDNQIEAQVLEGLLTERGIRYALELFSSHAYSEVFSNLKGYARVMVFKDDLAEAKLALADLANMEDSAATDDDEQS